MLARRMAPKPANQTAHDDRVVGNEKWTATMAELCKKEAVKRLGRILRGMHENSIWPAELTNEAVEFAQLAVDQSHKAAAHTARGHEKHGAMHAGGGPLASSGGAVSVELSIQMSGTAYAVLRKAGARISAARTDATI